MNGCEMFTEEGRVCGRRGGLERVMVRGPGFTVPETRIACARCRGEEVILMFAKAPTFDRARPMCPGCRKRYPTTGGICATCRNTINCHIRTYPDRLPRPGTIARAAISAIDPDVARTYGRGADILRIQAQINGGG